MLALLRMGLKPGHLVTEGGRVDVHFSPFPPYDRRNEMMRNKIVGMHFGQPIQMSSRLIAALSAQQHCVEHRDNPR